MRVFDLEVTRIFCLFVEGLSSQSFVLHIVAVICILQSSLGKESTVIGVAVKSLKHDSMESDRVRFLQEAALMAQFKHHNVMKLYGVMVENGRVGQ